MEKNKIEKIYDQIHTPENLKQETFEKMIIKSNKKRKYSFVLSIAALFIFALSIGTIYYKNKPFLNNNEIQIDNIAFEMEDSDLNHFQSVNELRNFLDKNYKSLDRNTTKGLDINSETEDFATNESATVQYEKKELSDSNYYKTNTQVENVDEADIVKTDGNYIYYVSNNTIYIVKANELNLESKIDYIKLDNNSRYCPNEIFIKDNKLVVIGNYIEYSDDNNELKNRISQKNINTTKAYIYDISDKKEPKEIRQVDIDGDYSTSRFIEDTLYLISTKYMYYNSDMSDEELLPIYYDSAFSDEYKKIDCTKIIYNNDSDIFVYKTIGAVNINNNDEILVETFLGYGETVYCSENNLYFAVPKSNEGNSKVLNTTEIYKFNISGGGLKYDCKNIINGNVNDQFSIDEYNGNLRIATTVTVELEPNINSSEGYDIVEFGKNTTNNILYVLDEDLKVIGELSDFGLDEKIYSVRFIKNTAYIVTFEQIDPLFIIDLSDPTNPTMKGKLEIPGYSSYLHLYDENHIIGIGYNVKDNGYGGVTNETIKLSMFDVSDLSNPKEIFTKSLGKGYSYSNVTYNHKLLMYDKQRNLMGFPISMKDEKGKIQDSILIIDIDMNDKEFKIHSQYKAANLNDYIRKVIYIDDTLYILCDSEILSFDINTLENLSNLQLPYDRNNSSITKEINIIE